MLNPLKKQTEEEKSKGDEFNATGEENVRSNQWLLKVYSMISVLVLTLILVAFIEVANRTLPPADRLNFDYNSGRHLLSSTSFQTLAASPTNPSAPSFNTLQRRQNVTGSTLALETVLVLTTQTITGTPVIVFSTTTVSSGLVTTLFPSPVNVTLTITTNFVTVQRITPTGTSELTTPISTPVAVILSSLLSPPTSTPVAITLSSLLSPPNSTPIATILSSFLDLIASTSTPDPTMLAGTSELVATMSLPNTTTPIDTSESVTPTSTSELGTSTSTLVTITSLSSSDLTTPTITPSPLPQSSTLNSTISSSPQSITISSSLTVAPSSTLNLTMLSSTRNLSSSVLNATIPISTRNSTSSSLLAVTPLSIPSSPASIADPSTSTADPVASTSIADPPTSTFDPATTTSTAGLPTTSTPSPTMIAMVRRGTILDFLFPRGFVFRRQDSSESFSTVTIPTIITSVFVSTPQPITTTIFSAVASVIVSTSTPIIVTTFTSSSFVVPVVSPVEPNTPLSLQSNSGSTASAAETAPSSAMTVLDNSPAASSQASDIASAQSDSISTTSTADTIPSSAPTLSSDESSPASLHMASTQSDSVSTTPTADTTPSSAPTLSDKSSAASLEASDIASAQSDSVSTTPTADTTPSSAPTLSDESSATSLQASDIASAPFDSVSTTSPADITPSNAPTISSESAAEAEAPNPGSAKSESAKSESAKSESAKSESAKSESANSGSTNSGSANGGPGSTNGGAANGGDALGVVAGGSSASSGSTGPDSGSDGSDGSGDHDSEGSDGSAGSADAFSSLFPFLSKHAVLPAAKSFVGGYMPASIASAFGAATAAFHSQAMDMAPFNDPTVSSMFGEADAMSMITFLPTLAALALVAIAPMGISYNTTYGCSNPNALTPLNPCPPILTSNHAALRSMQGALGVIAVVTVTVVVMWFAKPSGGSCDPCSIAGIAAVGGHPQVAHDFACPTTSSTRSLRKQVAGNRYRIGEWVTDDGTKRFGIKPDTEVPEPGFIDKIKAKLPSMPEIAFVESTLLWMDVNWQKWATITDTLFVTYVAVIVVITGAYLQSGEKSVFAPIFANPTPGRRIAFSIVAGLVSKYIGTVDRDTQTLAPYMDLQTRHALPKATIILRKHSVPITAFMPLLLAGHWVSAAVTLSVLLGQFLIVTMTGMPSREGQTHGEFVFCTAASLTILGFIALTVIASNIWRRRLPHLPRKPDNVAAVLSYIAGSQVCANFEGVERAQIPVRDRRILALGRKYGFGVKKSSENAPERLVIDEMSSSNAGSCGLSEKRVTYEYYSHDTKK